MTLLVPPPISCTLMKESVTLLTPASKQKRKRKIDTNEEDGAMSAVPFPPSPLLPEVNCCYTSAYVMLLGRMAIRC